MLRKMPYPWGQQKMVLENFSQMMVNNCYAPLLLVWPTGGGKLAVWDSFAVLLALVLRLPAITPLLSQGADEANAYLAFGYLTVLQLDEVKDAAMQLLLLPSDTTKMILLFISTQPLLLQNNSCWQLLLVKELLLL